MTLNINIDVVYILYTCLWFSAEPSWSYKSSWCC